MCPIFNGCGDTAVWILRIKTLQNVWRKDKLRIDIFIGYVNDLNKLQQFKVSVQKSHHRLQCTFQPSWQQYVQLPPPKIFTIPLETPYICIYKYIYIYINLLLGIEIQWNTAYLTTEWKQISLDLFTESVYIQIRVTGMVSTLYPHDYVKLRNERRLIRTTPI